MILRHVKSSLTKTLMLCKMYFTMRVSIRYSLSDITEVNFTSYDYMVGSRWLLMRQVRVKPKFKNENNN